MIYRPQPVLGGAHRRLRGNQLRRPLRHPVQHQNGAGGQLLRIPRCGVGGDPRAVRRLRAGQGRIHHRAVRLHKAAYRSLLKAPGHFTPIFRFTGPVGAVQPHRQHQTGGQPSQGSELGPLEQRDHLGLFFRSNALHHALGEALGGLGLLQLAKSVPKGGQLLPHLPAAGTAGQMFAQLPLLLLGQSAVQPYGQPL